MKKLTLISFLLLSAAVGYSQNSFYNNSYEARNSGSFSQETSLLSFGIGFPNIPVNGYTFGVFNGNTSGFGPIYAKYEHGFLRDEVGLGGVFANSFGSYKYNNGNNKTKIFAWAAGVMGYYHFNKLIPVEKLDVYAGAGFILRSRSYKYDDGSTSNNTDTNFNFNGVVGARYYFVQSFGAYLELGFDSMSDVNLGVTLRF
jgi:hypothetical protein